MIVLRIPQLTAELGEHLQRLQCGVDSIQRSASVTLADGCGAKAVGLVDQGTRTSVCRSLPLDFKASFATCARPWAE